MKLKREDYDQIVDHAKACVPEEACGLLAGVITDDGDKEVRKVYMIENIDHTNEHFSMDPRDQLAAIKDMRKNGLTPLGNWHSHPETPSRPSDEDKRLANDSKASYVILSLMDTDHPDINSFHITGEDTTGDGSARKSEKEPFTFI